MSNILVAIINAKRKQKELTANASGPGNRISLDGKPLENFVRSLFVSVGADEREVFSYQGSANNPPDAMLRGGDAIEIKKVETLGSTIPLNSSFPKQSLIRDDPMITKACRDSENWTEKDIIYTIGYVKDQEVRAIWFVYGDCYAADKRRYQKYAQAISDAVIRNDPEKCTVTKELGRITKLDPTERTNLRVRGMWEIVTPVKAFSELDRLFSPDHHFQVYCLRESRSGTRSQKLNVVSSKATVIRIARELRFPIQTAVGSCLQC